LLVLWFGLRQSTLISTFSPPTIYAHLPGPLQRFSFLLLCLLAIAQQALSTKPGYMSMLCATPALAHLCTLLRQTIRVYFFFFPRYSLSFPISSKDRKRREISCSPTALTFLFYAISVRFLVTTFQSLFGVFSLHVFTAPRSFTLALHLLRCFRSTVTMFPVPFDNPHPELSPP